MTRQWYVESSELSARSAHRPGRGGAVPTGRGLEWTATIGLDGLAEMMDETASDKTSRTTVLLDPRL